MARNGSGTYAKANTFESGTAITASSHNANWDDIATEITNSVAADGQTTMTGQLKAANGSAAAPAVAFGSDLDTGMYRIGANNIGVAVAGSKVLDVSATGLNVVGAISQGGGMPGYPGEIKIWPGATEPTGWVFCDGQELAEADYAALYAVLGTTYNTGGETAGHFRVPDITGRVIAGKEATATRLTTAIGGVDGDALGATGGTQSHTLTQAQLSTAIGAITVTDSRTFAVTATKRDAARTVTSGSGDLKGCLDDASLSVTPTGSITATITNASGGNAHPNVQPTIVMNYIIKT